MGGSPLVHANCGFELQLPDATFDDLEFCQGAWVTPAQDAIGAEALSTVVGLLMQRSDVCAKVIDRDGQVTAINRRGLDLLDTTREDVCGQLWVEFWEGEDHAAAKAAVEVGFAGKACEFVGTFRTDGVRSAWEIEILPLEWRDGVVQSLLVLSTRFGAPLDGAPLAAPHPGVLAQRQLTEAFRVLAAVADLSTSGAEQLRHGPLEGDGAEHLARALEEAGRRASQAIEDLGALLGTNARMPAMAGSGEG